MEAFGNVVALIVEAVRKLALALRVTIEVMRVLEESHQFLKRT
jgi:hypothetical protein